MSQNICQALENSIQLTVCGAPEVNDKEARRLIEAKLKTPRGIVPITSGEFFFTRRVEFDPNSASLSRQGDTLLLIRRKSILVSGPKSFLKIGPGGPILPGNLVLGKRNLVRFTAVCSEESNLKIWI